MKSLSGTLSTILFLGAAVARAQAPPPAPTPPPIWSGDASVSFVQTTGNSQNRSLGAGLNLVYQNAPWKVAFTTAFIETKADDVETSRRFNAGYGASAPSRNGSPPTGRSVICATSLPGSGARRSAKRAACTSS
jgi:hypothetical protein